MKMQPKEVEQLVKSQVQLQNAFATTIIGSLLNLIFIFSFVISFKSCSSNCADPAMLTFEKGFLE